LLLWGAGLFCNALVVERRIASQQYTRLVTVAYAAPVRAAAADELEVTVALKPRNLDVLKRRLLEGDSSSGHLTRLEVDSLVENKEGVAVMLAHLASNGVSASAVSISRAGAYMTIVLPVSVLEAVFETQIYAFRRIVDGTVLLRAEDCSLPASVAAHVIAVLDLVHFPITELGSRSGSGSVQLQQQQQQQ
jgi:hypothetical protein